MLSESRGREAEFRGCLGYMGIICQKNNNKESLGVEERKDLVNITKGVSLGLDN